MAEQKPELIVIFGGQSPEHDVSCTSARHVYDAIPKDLFNITLVGIDRSGVWHKCLSSEQSLSKTEFQEALKVTGAQTTPYELFKSDPQTKPIVFPVLHGPNGEDGSIQGLLESFGVPYVGSGVLSSALCMDKIKSKELLSAHNIPQVPWTSLHVGELDSATKRIERSDLVFPLFVKPANMGSSIGVSKVLSQTELDRAITKASEFDDWLIVEESSTGREIEVALLETSELLVSKPGEIVPGADFYDYNDKYQDGAELYIPAKLSNEEIDAVQSIAKEVFKLMRCEGLARIDFFYDIRGSGWLVNEINTLPGFTPISMYPKLMQEAGISYKDLVIKLLESAKRKPDFN